uniref:Secreted protein n=1 Tax=Rhipicephalus appendiculatus TaxID=34631 RepID=A0A131YCL6_RHIAP
MCVCMCVHIFSHCCPFHLSCCGIQKCGSCVESLVRSPLTRRHSHGPFYKIAVHVGVRARAPLTRHVVVHRLRREVRFETACFAITGLC